MENIGSCVTMFHLSSGTEKAMCTSFKYSTVYALTKITHKFHVYATYKFLPAVVSFWRIRELTGFCMQMSFTYKNFM